MSKFTQQQETSELVKTRRCVEVGGKNHEAVSRKLNAGEGVAERLVRVS